jgi:hypothetical protein
MFIFSYLLEVTAYTKIKNFFVGKSLIKSIFKKHYMRIGIEGQRIFRKKKTWYGHGCIRAY